jgi:tetratricopeptide (TPR) repeat protein
MMVLPLIKNRVAHFITAVFIFISFEITHSQPPPSTQNQILDYDLNIVYNLQRLGNFESALDYLDMLKSKYGEQPQIISLYKNIFLDAKMYSRLEDVIRKQLDKSPDNPVFLAELGNARFLQDDPDAADSLWALALEKGEKNHTVYFYVANFKLRYGDYDGAVETYLLGRERFGISDLFSSELASLYESQRNYPAAVNEYLIRLIKKPNTFLSISPKILEMVEDSDNIDDIITTVEEKIEKNKNVDVLYEILGDIYIKTGRMNHALETYRILGRDKKDDGESLYRFAERCIDFKAYNTAIEAIDEYLSKSTKFRRKERALLLKGVSLKSMGYNSQALDLLQELSRSATDLRIRSEAGYMMGGIYSQMDLCPEAVVVWENTLDFCRDHGIRTNVIYEMAQCHIKLGSYHKADSLLTIVAGEGKIEDIRQSALFLLGDLALFKGKYEDARRTYLDIVRKYPGGDFANDAIARISVITELGVDTAGITADNSVLDLYADAVQAHVLEKHNDAARILLNEKIINSPVGERALYYAGTIYAEADSGTRAINTFKNYIEKYPEGFFIDRVYLMLGDQYVKNPETFELGKEAYNTILETFQEGPVTELARDRLRRLESQGKIG